MEIFKNKRFPDKNYKYRGTRKNYVILSESDQIQYWSVEQFKRWFARKKER